jgi:hypothetical protein
MKIKLDENLPLQIEPRLRTLGHDVHTMQDEGLSGCNDSDLWRAAQREGRSLLMQRPDCQLLTSLVHRQAGRPAQARRRWPRGGHTPIPDDPIDASQAPSDTSGPDEELDRQYLALLTVIRP